MSDDNKITELTDEQWEHVYKAREKWRAVGTCTEPCDRPTFEKIVSVLYERIGQKAPTFVWADGPSDMYLLGAMLEADCPVEDLPKEITPELREKYKKAAHEQLGRAIYGCEWAWWIGYFDTARKELNVKYSEDADEVLEDWVKLLGVSGWWLPYESVCVCAERHKELHFDDNYMLHCEDGPAIECRDGTKVYAWHGTRVPKEWIEDGISAVGAIGQDNVELRRAACEIVGWDRVLEELGAKEINRHPDERVGTLLEVDMPDAPGSRFLRVTCATGRKFVFPVENTAQTALEANAASYGIPVVLFGANLNSFVRT